MELSGRKTLKTDGHKTCLLCDPCKGANENKQAEGYCTMCNEYLCYDCRKAHTRATITKSHQILEGDNFPKLKPTSSKKNMCSKHSDRPLEYYCKKDDQFSCSVCATVDHKQCGVQSIDDMATDFHKSKEHVALEKATADLIRSLQETKVTATRNINKIETIHADFISDIQQFRSEINNLLDSLEKAAMTKASIARDSDQERVNTIATACDSMLSDIQRKTSELEELNKYKQNRQLVICSKWAMKTVNAYGIKVTGLSNRNRVRDYKFQSNEEILRFLYSLHSLGDMKEEKKDETQQGTSKNKGVESSTLSLSQPTQTHVGNIEVKHFTDKLDSWITGGVVMDQTRLALVDCNNLSVKIADLDRNTVISCIKLPTRPWDITCVNQDQIVVTCNNRNVGKLVFLKVGKSLSVEKELDIEKNCQCIVYTNGTFFVTFLRPDSSIEVINMNGTTLKTFKLNQACGALFSHTMYISLSTDQQTVFVSDWSNHTVTSLTLDGTVHHVYTANSLKCPHGVAADRNGNIYIAGYYSHNIHQLSTDGNLSQVILDKTDGMKYPCVVTYCKTRHRLYISVHNGSYDEVSVYQLR